MQVLTNKKPELPPQMKDLAGMDPHPICQNPIPFFPYMTVLAPYPLEELPQVAGEDIIKMVMNTFLFCSNKTMVLGFNSIGGFSSVNHLHFHIFFTDQLPTKSKKLPV